MPIFSVEAPNGKIYDIEGPEGASEEDIFSFANQAYLQDIRQPEEPVAKPAESGFIPSVKRGAASIQSLVGDVAPAMIGRVGEKLGISGAGEYAEKQMLEAAKAQEEIQQKYPAAIPSYTDIKSGGDLLTYVTESIGELIPSMIPSLLTGGAAGIAGRGAVIAAEQAAKKASMDAAQKTILSAAGSKLSKEQLIDAAKAEAVKAGTDAANKVALRYQAAGAVGGSAIQNIPEVYQNVAQETGKEDLGAALMFGGFNSILDAITPLALLRKAKGIGLTEKELIGAWYKRGAKGLGTGFLTEGGTEAVQEMSSAAAEKFVDENKEFFTEKNFERFINAGLKGGIGGGTVSGLSNIALGKAQSSEEAAGEKPPEQRPGRPDELVTEAGLPPEVAPVAPAIVEPTAPVEPPIDQFPLEQPPPIAPPGQPPIEPTVPPIGPPPTVPPTQPPAVDISTVQPPVGAVDPASTVLFDRAKKDSEVIDLSKLEFDNGRLSTKDLEYFVDNVPDKTGLISQEGDITPLAYDRLKSAILQKAYNDPTIVSSVTKENVAPNAREILRGLSQAAPKVANLQDAGDYDIRSNVSTAAKVAMFFKQNDLDMARLSDPKVQEYIKQNFGEIDPVTSGVLNVIGNTDGSSQQVAEQLNQVSDAFAAEYQKPEADRIAPSEVLTQFIKPIEPSPVVIEKPEFEISKPAQEIYSDLKTLNGKITALADWAVANAPNSFAKEVATKVAKRLKEFEQLGVKSTFNIYDGKRRPTKSYLGVLRHNPSPKGSGNLVFSMSFAGLNSQGKADSFTGTTYSTILHELLHAASRTQLGWLGSHANLPKLPGYRETQFFTDMTNLLNRVRNQVKIDQKKSNPHEAVRNIMAKAQYVLDVDELLSYGLTDKVFQDYLSTIKIGNKTGFTKLVEAIRKLFNINTQYESALDRLLRITEEGFIPTGLQIQEEFNKGIYKNERGYTFGKPQPPTTPPPSTPPLKPSAPITALPILTAPPGFKPKKGRVEQVVLAARELAAGRITRQQYDAYVDMYMPITTILGDKLEDPIADDVMRDILTNKIPQKKKDELVNAPIKEGERVGLRMDIPALDWGRNNGVNGSVVSIHKGKDKDSKTTGDNLSYKSTGALKNVVFAIRSEEDAFKIAQQAEPERKTNKSGKEILKDVSSKNPQQTIEGNWVNMTPEETIRLVKEKLNDPSWTQVSLDPLRHSYFYDRATRMPVVSASEVLQVGRFVLAKDVVFDDPKAFLYNKPVDGAFDEDAERVTKTAGVKTSGEKIRQTVQAINDNINNDDYMTGLRVQWFDKNSGLTKVLSSQPVFDMNGQLRADMLLRTQDQMINLIRNGLQTGTIVVNSDGSLVIDPNQKANLAESLVMADKLDGRVVLDGKALSGRDGVAEVARILRGEEIINEDIERRAKGVEQLAEAKKYIKSAREIQKKLDALYDELHKKGPAKDRTQEDKNAVADLVKQKADSIKYAKYLRQQGYANKKMNRELQVTPEKISWAKEQLKKVPELESIFKVWRDVNEGLIQLRVDTGLLTEEQAEGFRKNKSYVPLYKSAEDMEEADAIKYGTGTKSVEQLKRIKGSFATRNIWENLNKHYAATVSHAYQNQTRKIATEQLVALGGAEISDSKDSRVNLRYRDPTSEFADNRGVVHAIVQNPNALAAFQMMHYELGPIMKAFSFSTKVLRAGALINPIYWVRQLIRDPIHATLVANSGIVTPFHSARDYIQILTNNSEEAKLLARRGVIGPVDATIDIHEFLNQVGKEKTSPSVMGNMLHKVMKFHEASDAATRVSIYKKAYASAKSNGMSDAMAENFAVHKSRESINFSVRGNSELLNSIRHMIPFFSAAMTSLDTVYRAATGYGLNEKEKAEAQRMFYSMASMMAISSLVYAFMYHDDEDYNKLPDYVKDNNWLIPNPLGEGHSFIKVPIPFEVGFLFKTIPEASTRYLAGNSTGQEVLKSYISGIIHNLPGGGIPIPQAGKPLLETITNYSFFTGRPIESIGDLRLPIEMRGRNASEFAKTVSGAGLGSIGLSPSKIDYLIQGYVAELGSFTTGLVSSAIDESKGITRPEKNIEKYPVLKAFMTDPNSSKAIADFYDLEHNASQVVTAFNEMMATGNIAKVKELLSDEEKKKLLKIEPVLRDIGESMTAIRRQITYYKDNQTLDPEERRVRINNLERQYDKVASNSKKIAQSVGLM